MSTNIQDILKGVVDQYDAANRLQESLAENINTLPSSIDSIKNSWISTNSIMSDLNKKMKEVNDSANDFSSATILNRDYTSELEVTRSRLRKAEELGNISMIEKQQKILQKIEGQIAAQDLINAKQEKAIQNSEKLADSLFSWMDRIPIIGKNLDLGPVKQEFQNNVIGPLREGMMTGNMSFTSLKTIGSSAFKALGGAMKSLMANPMLLLGMLVIGAIKRFFELDKAAEDFRKTTGLTADQTKEIDKSVRQASREMAHLGVTIESAYKAASALSETFGKGAAGVSDNVKFVAAMNANLGISEETSAKTLQNFMGMGNMSSKAAKSSMILAASLAETAGVAPKAVMEDMANASEKTKIMMRGNVDQMMRLAVESRRVGLNIESVAGAARGHLDFQSSINAEMELSTLIGKNINLQKMRQLAFEGDLEGMLKEQQKQLRNVGDITKMNAFQQEAVAKAFGMSVDELVKMQAKEKINSEARANMSSAQIKALEDQAKKTKEIQERNDKIQELEAKAAIYKKAGGKLTKEQKADMDALAKLHAEQLSSMTKEQKMQNDRTQMTNQLKKLWVQIQDVLVPVVDVLFKIFVPTLKVAAAVISGFIKPIGEVFDKLLGSSMESEKFGKMMEKVVPIAEKIGVFLGNAFLYISWIGASVKLFRNSFAFLLKASRSMSRIGKSIMKPILFVFKIIKSIGSAVMGVGKMLFGWLKPVFSVFTVFGKFAGPLGIVLTTIDAIVLYVKDFISIWDSGDSIIKKVIKTILGIPKAIINAIVTPFAGLIDWIGGLFGFDNLGTKIADGISAGMDWVIDTVATGWESIFEFIKNLFTNPMALFSGLGDAFETIWNGIKSTFDFSFIKDKISEMTGFLPNWVQKKMGLTPMADGGVVTQATPILAGEAGAEAIIPLDQFNPLDNMIEKIGSFMTNRQDTSDTNEVVERLDRLISLLESGAIAVNMDGKKVASTVAASQKYA